MNIPIRGPSLPIGTPGTQPLEKKPGSPGLPQRPPGLPGGLQPRGSVPGGAPMAPRAALPPAGGLPQASSLSLAPRSAPLPSMSRTTAGAQPQPQRAMSQPATLGQAKSRQSLGIDPNRLRPSEVRSKATSLENVAMLKVEVLMLKEEVGAAQMKAKSDSLARGDTAGAARASQSGNELNAELDRAFGYLKEQEHKLIAAERGEANKVAAGTTQSAPAAVAAQKTPLKPGDSVSLDDLKPVSWFKLPFQMSRTEKIRKQYDNLKLPVKADTLPKFTDSQVMGEPKVLGSGACNTVYSVKLQNTDGTTFAGVFKPLSSTEEGAVADESGIPLDNPQTAMRNLATVDYAKALGFDVVCDTHLAALKTTSGDSAPSVGLVMEKAKGKPASQIPPEKLLEPDVMRETTKLQLLDHLTGQGDRHYENYFIDIAPDGRVTVSGIDNDQCFGKNLKDPADIARKGADSPFWGTNLPPTVDTDMASAINKLKPDDLKAMLGDKLSGPEVDAAISRLDGMKKHIAGLESQGRVIDPKDWGSPASVKPLDPTNSYLGRDVMLAMQKKW